ncbi:MAG: hypothetical protein M1825_002781 [Sarcosagium campestre]|nr:MAG: hypothetical protein M1825_002781 [Sarcosagium campestre]
MPKRDGQTSESFAEQAGRAGSASRNILREVGTIQALNMQRAADGYAAFSLPVPRMPLSHNSLLDTAPFLQVFQVREPLSEATETSELGVAARAGFNDKDEASHIQSMVRACSQTLMIHSFAFSYGRPFIGEYNPPNCTFDRVSIEFAVVSAGRQFDRLGTLFFGDVEVFRTSTAEPTAAGIEWHYFKDLSALLALFKRPQKIIFDLGNLIDDTYTAPFNATLTATFSRSSSPLHPAEEIYAISAQRAALNQSSVFSLPQDKAVRRLAFPRNVRRAVVTLSACGQADEEFWFGNVLSSTTHTFPPTIEPLFGHSPFREVQLLIDGQLAGVVWPFPIIFTGGVAPGLWRPVVGIDAFDLREQEIDITPFLTVLCDGAIKGHSFEIRVVGIKDDGHGHGVLSEDIGHSWIVSGKILLWLDDTGVAVTGQRPIGSSSTSILVSSSLRQDATGHNKSLAHNIVVQRYLSVASIIRDLAGPRYEFWSQSLNYINRGSISDRGRRQSIEQITSGSDRASNGYTSDFEYPISVNTTFGLDSAKGTFTIDAEIDRGLDLSVGGPAASPLTASNPDRSPANTPSSSASEISNLRTRQNGSAHYFSGTSKSNSSSFGRTEQSFYFSRCELRPGHQPSSATGCSLFEYDRHVIASNGSVIKDDESQQGQITHAFAKHRYDTSLDHTKTTFWQRSLRSILGRGPLEDPPRAVSSLMPLGR